MAMDWNGAAMIDPAITAAGGVLTIDLGAIRANYRALRGMTQAAVAGVVKADGYGLGAGTVARALVAEGCRIFFTAHLDEGLALRAHVPAQTKVIVLHGATAGAEMRFLEHGITPVLNTVEQVTAWSALAGETGLTLDALVQVDSGMTRFGLSEAEFHHVLAAGLLDGVAVSHIMSHLACADDPDHPANADQLANFRRMRARLPQAKASLAASSGIFLGADYHFDLVRPGAALYGVSPRPGANPIRPVVRLEARVMQVRDVPEGTAIGYGHTQITRRPTRLAVIAAGYADGFMRSLSSVGGAWLGHVRLPIMGRVSMDSSIVDVTDAPFPVVPGTLVELLGAHQGVDDVARAAGTIGYEILTSLGGRYARRIIG